MTATIAWRFTLAGIIGILATPLAVLVWAPLGFLGAASVLAIAAGDVHMRSASGLTVWQVKAGDAAKGASETLLGRWWADTNDQAVVAGADACVLLTQRRGVGVSRVQEWQAVVCLTDIAWLHDAGVDTSGLPKVPVRLPLGVLVGQVAR